MKNFELIDDYLANKLQASEMAEFKSKIDADPSLREEIEYQQQIIQGIKAARIAELKTMLSNVPIGNPFWSQWSVTKTAAIIVVGGLISTGLYFILQDSSPSELNPPQTKLPIDSVTPENKGEKNDLSTANKKKEEDKNNIIKDNSVFKTSPSIAIPEKQDEKVVVQPRRKLDIVDPSNEILKDESGNIVISTEAKPEISNYKTEVVTDQHNKKYKFHYNFEDGKLNLYGPFDNSLYEILEIHSTKNALFLFYKNHYYFLNSNQKEITPLEALADSSLIGKLKQYRSTR